MENMENDEKEYKFFCGDHDQQMVIDLDSKLKSVQNENKLLLNRLHGLEEINSNMLNLMETKNKDLEKTIADLKMKTTNMESQNKELMFSLGKLKLEYDNTITNNHMLLQKNQELTGLLNAKQEELCRLNAEYNKLETKNTDMTNDLTSLRDKQQVDAHKFESEITVLKSNFESLQKDYRRLESNHKSLIDESEQHNQDHNASMEEWNTKAKQLENEKSELSACFVRKEIDFIDLNSNLISQFQKLEKENQELRRLVTTSYDVVNTVNNENDVKLADMKAENGGLKDLLSQQKLRIDTIAAENALLHKSNDDCKREFERCNDDLAERNRQIRNLTHMMQTRKDDFESVKHSMSTQIKQLFQEINDLKRSLRNQDRDYYRKSFNSNKTIKFFEVENHRLKQNLEKSMADFRRVFTDNNYLKDMSIMHKDDIDSLRAEVDSLKKLQNKNDETVLNLTNANEKLKLDIVALDNEKAKLIKDNSYLIKKIDSNDRCMLTAKRKLSDLESTIEEKSKYGHLVENVVSQMQRHMIDMKNELQRLQSYPLTPGLIKSEDSTTSLCTDLVGAKKRSCRKNRLKRLKKLNAGSISNSGVFSIRKYFKVKKNQSWKERLNKPKIAKNEIKEPKVND